MSIITDAKIKKIDIGCGRPDQKYPGTFGIDLNPDYLPDLLHNCETGLPFPDNSLEFINSDNSLEHFRNPFFILTECHRVLQRGGQMRLVVPNAQYLPLILVNLVRDLGAAWHWYMNLPFKRGRSIHYSLFTKFIIKLLSGEAGFRLLWSRGWLYAKEIELRLQK